MVVDLICKLGREIVYLDKLCSENTTIILYDLLA